MELDEAIKERHSVRRFKSKAPDYSLILEALDAAIKVPYAGNINTIKFILVSDREKIIQLAEAAAQDFVATANYIVVFCSHSENCVRAYGDRGEIYSIQQAGASIQNFLLKITELGLSTCWVGAFSETTVRRILRIPDEIRVEGIFPIGYEMGKSKSKMKPKLDACTYFDVWKNRYMTHVRKPETR